VPAGPLHDGAEVSRRIRQPSRAQDFIAVGSVKVPAYLASQIPVARRGQRLLKLLLLLVFTLAPIWHCRDVGGARVEGHSAEGQRRHHDGAKVSRRIQQLSWAKGFVAVRSVKVPAYLASQTPSPGADSGGAWIEEHSAEGAAYARDWAPAGPQGGAGDFAGVTAPPVAGPARAEAVPNTNFSRDCRAEVRQPCARLAPSRPWPPPDFPRWKFSASTLACP